MKKKLNKIAKDTNLFLSRFLSKQKKTDLIKPIIYGLLPGGKKIRSKLIVDVGKIFKIKYFIFNPLFFECIFAMAIFFFEASIAKSDVPIPEDTHRLSLIPLRL